MLLTLPEHVEIRHPISLAIIIISIDLVHRHHSKTEIDFEIIIFKIIVSNLIHKIIIVN